MSEEKRLARAEGADSGEESAVLDVPNAAAAGALARGGAAGALAKGGAAGALARPARIADVPLVPPPAGVSVGRQRPPSWLLSTAVSQGSFWVPGALLWERLSFWPFAVVMIGIGGAVGGLWGAFLWRRGAPFSRLRRRLESLAHSTPGTRVHLRGRVLPGPTFTNATDGRPVVVAGYRGHVDKAGASPMDPRTEVHAVSFALALASGETVMVIVPPAPLLVDLEGEARRLPPADRRRREVFTADAVPVACEVSDTVLVAPGDLVDVIGVFDRILDFAGERPRPRDPPLSLVIRGTPRAPLLLRRVSADRGMASAPRTLDSVPR